MTQLNTSHVASGERFCVLAIDDSPEILDAIHQALADEFRVLAATDGRQGLEVAVRMQPDLVLLDVVMPEMDGFSVCEELKADPATRHIPVVFVTGLDARGDEMRGFAAGAVDFVTKPIEPLILRARVRSHVELGALNKALGNANAQLERERELMAEVIVSMRHEAGFCTERLSIAGHSGDRIGGDLVLSARHPNGDQHVLLGDFTGHGLSAAIGAPLVSHLFYDMTAAGERLDVILAVINRVLVQRLPTHIFMAAAAACLPADSKLATVWNFGSPDLLHRDRDGHWSPIRSTELPMGVAVTGESFESSSVSLVCGEYLYLMSDGPIEATVADRAQYGAQRLMQALDRHAQSVDAVFKDILYRALDPVTLDDMTLLRITGAGTA